MFLCSAIWMFLCNIDDAVRYGCFCAIWILQCNMNVSVQCNIKVPVQYERFYAIWMFLCNMNVSVQYGCFCAIWIFCAVWILQCNMNVSVQCNMNGSAQYKSSCAIWMFLCNMDVAMQHDIVSVQYGCYCPWAWQQLGQFIFMPPKELWEAYSNRTVRPSVPLRVRCISPIFFEVGIPNLVCECILGWGSVAYNFPVTVTLTSDLVFIVVKCLSVPLRVRCISPIFFEVGIPNLICGCILGWRCVAYHFWVTVTLT